MSKSIFLFNINDNFKSLRKENNLDIILDIFLKAKSSNFYAEQYNLIIGTLDSEVIKNNIIDNFKYKSNFYTSENKLIIRNIYKDIEETLFIYNNYIKIVINDNTSIFLEYIATYFMDLIAIELEDEKIYPLHLVKNGILV